MPCSTRGKDRRGATAVEFAIVAIPVFLFVFGIFEFGRLVMVKDLMREASREAARLASVNTNVTGSHANDMTAAEIENKVRGLVTGSGLDELSIQFSHVDDPTSGWKNATMQHQIAVTVTGNYTPMTPVFMLLGGDTNSIHMSETSIAYSEGH